MGVRRAHLVGSIPAVSAAEAMRLAVKRLGPELDYLPDGETGVRRNWVIGMIGRRLDQLRPRPPPARRRPGRDGPHQAPAGLAAAFLGMIVSVPVSIFENKPEFCPFGHRLWPGGAQVSWKPCICGPAREGAERGRGMGHVWVSCRTCHDQLRQTAFYEPPHDIRHHQAGV